MVTRDRHVAPRGREHGGDEGGADPGAGRRGGRGTGAHAAAPGGIAELQTGAHRTEIRGLLRPGRRRGEPVERRARLVHPAVPQEVLEHGQVLAPLCQQPAVHRVRERAEVAHGAGGFDTPLGLGEHRTAHGALLLVVGEGVGQFEAVEGEADLTAGGRGGGGLHEYGRRPRLAGLPGGDELVGDRGGTAALGVQQGGGAPVPRETPGHSEVPEDGFLGGPVPVAAPVQQTRLVEQLHECAGLDRADLREAGDELGPVRLADHGHGPGHGERVRLQAVQAAHDSFGEAVAHHQPGGRLRARRPGGRLPVLGQRRDEQGVAAGDGERAGGETVRHVRVEVASEQCCDAVAGQRGEPDLCAVRVAGQLGAQIRLSGAGAVLVAEDQHDARPAQPPREEEQALEGIGVRVADVVDPDEQGLLGAHVEEDP